MDLDTLRYLVLLRPLIVFLSAAPLVALVALAAWYGKRRRERRLRRAQEGKVDWAPAAAVTAGKEIDGVRAYVPFSSRDVEACRNRARKTMTRPGKAGIDDWLTRVEHLTC